MGVRTWAGSHFKTDQERREHCERALEQWQWIFKCHFWLLGVGAKEEVRGREFDEHDRTAAERERRKHGWTIETVQDAMDFVRSYPLQKSSFYFAPQAGSSPTARSRGKRALLDDGHSGFDALGWIPPPTVDRDWPVTYPSREREAEHVKAIQDAIDRRGGRGHVTGALAEVLIPGVATDDEERPW